MREPKRSVPVGLWKRYDTYGFGIAPSLAGASHSFEHNGYNIRLQLPNKPHQKDWNDADSRITCWSYRRRNSRKYPSIYNIHSVDLVLETGKTRQVRESALGTVNVTLFNESQRNQLDRFTHKYDRIIESAFDRWADVLRWKSSVHTLCLFRQNSRRSRWGTYLIDISTHEDFYAPPRIFKVEAVSAVTKKSWNMTQNALNEHIDVPIWHLYFAEANQKLYLGDTRGFIIDLAVSAETVIRKTIRELIGNQFTPGLDDMVSRIQIGQIIDNWFHLGFNNKSWRGLKDEKGLVKHVIDIRNGIMHRGENPELKTERSEELARAVHSFIVLCEAEKSAVP